MIQEGLEDVRLCALRSNGAQGGGLLRTEPMRSSVSVKTKNNEASWRRYPSVRIRNPLHQAGK